MQNSSEFQQIAIDTIHESATNPRRTFNEFFIDDAISRSMQLRSVTSESTGSYFHALGEHLKIYGYTLAFPQSEQDLSAERCAAGHLH